jgi:alkylation response protein AidB-like acyl-CoA dehydrogenase
MDRQHLIIENARKFLKNDIRPFVRSYDKEGKLPRKIIEKVALHGYLGAAFPEKYGGLNLDDLHYGLLIEEFGKVCSSLRSLLTVNTSLVGQTILRWGTEEQKSYWLPLIAKGEKIGALALTEPEIGSDAKNIQTKYDVDENYFLLNGAKKWITFGEIADFYLVSP